MLAHRTWSSSLAVNKIRVVVSLVFCQAAHAWIPWGCLFPNCTENLAIIDGDDDNTTEEEWHPAPWAKDLVCHVTPKERPKQVSVACVGDSITAGVGCVRPNESYPARLQAMLGSSYAVSNFGACGATVRRDGYFSYWDSPHWQAALDSNADIYVLMLGTNDAVGDWEISLDDSVSSFRNDYMAMVSTLQRLPSQPDIFVGVPPPLYYGPQLFGIQQTVVNDLLPDLIENVTTEMGLQHLPISAFEALGGANLSRPELLPDYIHPSAAGHQVIAEIVKEALDTVATTTVATTTSTTSWTMTTTTTTTMTSTTATRTTTTSSTTQTTSSTATETNTTSTATTSTSSTFVEHEEYDFAHRFSIAWIVALNTGVLLL